MALIIKGGEIPVDCLGCDEMVMLSQCPIRLNEPLKYCNGTRHPDCPIIGEIPDKHGDLIDRKETRKQILEDLSKMKTNLPFDVFGLIIDSVDFLLTKAPTIVEAIE